MKRWVAFLSFFVLAIGAMGLVLADECSLDSQEMFTISSSTNAHGQVWDQTSYDEAGRKLCYDNYFRSVYSGGNLHGCVSGNKVLRLSDFTNAHAEGPSGLTNGYVDVCYGDLSCFIQAPNKNCNEAPGNITYSLIVSLSTLTNAHLTLTNAYNYSICCRSNTALPLCNYNTTCEQGNGESPENCPDCASVCGNNKTEGVEECDGTDLGGLDCTNYAPDSGYVGGTLGCYDNSNPETACTFRTNLCDLAECSNDGDDDEDDLIDELDPGCWTNENNSATYDPQRNDESVATSECQDGRDNDGDGDFDLEDESCGGNKKGMESYCGDGNIDPDEDCDCGTDGSCSGGELGSQTCSNLEFGTGNLSCIMSDNSCMFNYTGCSDYGGFCEMNMENFVFVDSATGALVQPSSCSELNKVYSGTTSVQNETNRRQLCENHCLPAAEDPANNGYGGAPPTSAGCAWQSNPDGSSVTYDGECYFQFTMGDPTELCRIDYSVIEECGPNDPFRLVEVTPTTVPAGQLWSCDAGCGAGTKCETEIMCPRVVQLPFFGAIGIALAAIIIAGVYMYTRRK